MLAAHYGDQYQLVLVFAVAFPVMFFAGAMRKDRARVAYSLAITVFGFVWIAIPFAHAVLLRDLPDHGAALLIDVLVATFVADTCAYGAGRWFGRIPLAPSLSPNKTVEGLIGGVLGGTLGFWFAGLYQDWLPGLDALAIGALHRPPGPDRRPLRIDDQARPGGRRTQVSCLAPTEACSTASTRSCSPSWRATTCRLRSCTDDA